MTLARIETLLNDKVQALRAQGVGKGQEKPIAGIRPAADGFGPRYLLEGAGDTPYLRMNSNAYLGLGLDPRVIRSEAEAADRFGAGPGAVRFISGTYRPHVALEKKLAAFHGREAAMLFSAAYATMLGVLPQLIAEETLVVSDALNHNCIINAIRLAQPARKEVFAHGDLDALDHILASHRGRFKRVCVITDGVFSMRGDHADLAEIETVCRRHEDAYEQGIITLADDSHGVGAFGRTGRGTEEVTGGKADVLIGTLGKAFGVNGGYVASSAAVIAYLRESAPLYIYSNPITPGEAAAALTALQIVDSHEGLDLLEKLRRLSLGLRAGLERLGFETLPGEHPIVPILVRDTTATAALAEHLFTHGILATGLNYPVIPKGEEEIRLQVSANHTEKDLGFLLEVLGHFKR
ncbi:aminotransferase class I/II-fold pyridoxal phosphate-dependent enzyme [Methylomicrobium sp. RS1]|uniref:aminotransferase class I/II-fold pyridoxal phosphate-dependent enzyme n=1 Tax=Candidatus Methylomicrobium oryzae TaxID=2802053 RepID=UPI001924DCFA|nr:aminotransferase class I/II-fold pyridoxal phosphate-dependent enzyme [Methylomicrobium sp. RS1]MBL1265336.1 aminotransferase class I/II-fold pyridoxal phosphate-dependent enzyme [Methylomicrobium sp. RS1]